MVYKAQVRTYLSTLRLFSRPVRLYLCAEALNGFTVDGGIYAVLFNLYLLRLGYTPTFIGVINAAGLLAFGLGSLPAGLVGGRLGSQRLVIVGLSIMVVNCGLLPLAEFIEPVWQPTWLMVTYVSIYIGLAVYIANVAPFIMAATQPKERNHAFSMASATWFLSGFAGNLVGGWLPAFFAIWLGISPDQPAAYRYALILAAFLLIPAVLVMYNGRHIQINHLPDQPQKTGAIPLGPIGALTLVRLLQVTGVGSLFLFLNIYLDEGLGTQTAAIGALLAIGRLGAVVAAVLAPLVVAQWNNRYLIIGAATGIVLSLMPLVFIPHWGAAMLSFIGVVALTAIRMPAFTVYSMEAVPPEHRAAMSGASEMANGLGFALIGLAGGYIITALGYRPLFLVSAGLTLLGTLIFWWYSRRHPAGSSKSDPAVTKRTLGRVGLSRPDPANSAIFHQYLTSPRAGVVLYALGMLEAITPEALPVALPTLLEHPHREVRLEVLRRIERLGLTTLIPLLQAKLKTEGSLAVQGACLRTLAVLSDAPILDQIIPYLDHPDSHLRQGALVGLLRSGELEGILAASEKLVRLINSPNSAEREFAARVLGEAGVASFYRSLLRLLNDDNPQVQRAALNAAGKLQHPRLWPVVIDKLTSPQVHPAAIVALAMGGPTVIPALKTAFVQNGSEQKIEERMRLIGLARVCERLDPLEVCPLLLDKLAYPNAQVRGQILKTLNKLGYQVSQPQQTLIYQQIENEVAQAAWTLATWHDLGQAEVVTRLKTALQANLARHQERLFGWLSLLFNSTLIRRIQEELVTGKNGNQALKRLPATLPPDLRAKLVSVLGQVEPTEQLQRINLVLPQQNLPLQDRLRAIIASSDEWLNAWTKVCALYTVGQLMAVELSNVVTTALDSSDPLVHQSAIWTLLKLGDQRYLVNPTESLVTAQQGEPDMLMLVEKVLCLKAIDFLAESREEVLADIAALLEEQSVKAGQVILDKGEIDNAMYLIVEGQVRLRDGARIINTLDEHEFFGELMLLNPIPQTVSISAISDTYLLRLTQAAFRQVLEEHDEIAWPIMQRLAQRLQRAQSQSRGEQVRADLLGGLQERLTRPSNEYNR